MENKVSPPPYVGPSDVEPPPSYDSLFGKLKKAKEESDGNVDFCKNCCAILCGSIACTICLAVFIAIPLTMIIIGSIHLHDCPAERYIPIYLIVAGCIGIVSNIVMMARAQYNKKKKEAGEETNSTGIPEQILNSFLFAWFIAGNVWVYRTYDDWQGSNSALDTYCHPRVYYFAFWIITSSYIVLGLCLIILIVLCIVGCCCKKD